MRWLGALGLVVWRWQSGGPTTWFGWVPVLIVVGLLLLPDLDSITIGGLKLEVRRAREEVADLRQQVKQLQVSQANAVGAVIGNDAISAFSGGLGWPPTTKSRL